jgi:DNA-directed RNA polymerase subunit F
LRREADLDASVVSLVEIYDSVLRRHKQTPENLTAETQAMLKYLRKIVPLVQGTDLVLQIDRPDRPAT